MSTARPATVHQLGNSTVSQVLKLGSRGAAVAELQAKLNLLQYGPLNIDQNFDERTKAALEQFQKAEGLPVSSQLDPMTENRLNQKVLMVSGGGRRAQQVGTVPAAVPTRPLWQTGLMVLGAIAIGGGVLYVLLNDGADSKKGYRRGLPEGREARELPGRYDSRGARVAGVERGERDKKCKQTPDAEAFVQGKEVSL